MNWRRLTLSRPMALLSMAAMVLVLSLITVTPSHAAGLGPADNLHVSGNHILDGNSHVVQLRGVNYSGPEYACIQGWGIFDGPSDAAQVAAIASWGASVVRLPLNEDCWLGINGATAQYSGVNYRNAIMAYVGLLHAAGLHAELSLIWAAPGTNQATYQPGGPDADHAPAFWASLAQAFAGDITDILAPWGETIVDANCFLSGGVCEATYGTSNTPYAVAGMQQAVSVMRASGYTGIISVPGIDYANDLTQWLSHMPSDPLANLIAEAHVYGNNTCGAQNAGACLKAQMSPVAAVVPLILGEFGETYDDSSASSANTKIILDWADSIGASWEAWTWDTWNTLGSLISNFNGTPNGTYGTFVRTRMLADAGTAPTPTPVPPTPTGTPVPPTPTSTPPPSPTPSPTPPPDSCGGLALVQTASLFIDYSGVAGTETGADFPKDVKAGDLLVSTVGVAGGNPFTVSGVTDDLGNTWKRAIAGVNGDNSDVEIWWTVSAKSGPDGAYAALVLGSGGDGSNFAQSYIVNAEFNGGGSLHAGHAASQGLSTTTRTSGVFTTSPGDLIVGGYDDAGYVGVLSITDGKSLLGSKFDNFDAIQMIDSYGYAAGSSGSVSYANTHGARSEIAGASFTPTSGCGTPTPTPTPTPPPLPSPTPAPIGVPIDGVPCTIILNGSTLVGTCTGTFHMAP